MCVSLKFSFFKKYAQLTDILIGEHDNLIITETKKSSHELCQQLQMNMNPLYYSPFENHRILSHLSFETIL